MVDRGAERLSDEDIAFLKKLRNDIEAGGRFFRFAAWIGGAVVAISAGYAAIMHDVFGRVAR
jgi:hypothetical protein